MLARVRCWWAFMRLRVRLGLSPAPVLVWRTLAAHERETGRQLLLPPEVRHGR